MEMFKTEDKRNDAVEIISETAMLEIFVTQILYNTRSSRKRMVKDLFYEQLGYTSLLSRYN